MTKQVPPMCKETFRWIKHRLGTAALAPLTGQDQRALKAFAHLLEVYATADPPGERAAVRALGAILLAMQEKVWPLAKCLIPMILDWEAEEKLWNKIQLARHACAA